MTKQINNSNFELTGTVNLGDIDAKQNESSDNRFQFLYAGQLYGTFFGIFGSFQSKHKSDQNYELTHASFLLVNYRGDVNLGLDDKIVGNINTITVPQIYQDGAIDLRCIDFSINIIPFAKSFIVQEANLKDCNIIKGVDHLSVSVYPKPIDSSSVSHPPSVEDTHFDGERYERSGIFYKERDIITASTELHKLHKMQIPSDNGLLAPWGFCPRGVNRIVFA